MSSKNCALCPVQYYSIKQSQLKGTPIWLVLSLNASMMNLSVEIGYVILPAFQRTFVTTNAIGTLLKICLDVPSEGGIGFRRVVWTADNDASLKTAERMGFKYEGWMWWTWATWALGHEKLGKRLGRKEVKHWAGIVHCSPSVGMIGRVEGRNKCKAD